MHQLIYSISICVRLVVPVGSACVGEQRGDKHRLCCCCCCCQETRCKAAQLRTAETINSSAAQSFTGTTHHITHVAKQQHRAKQHHCILYYVWIRAEVSLLNVDVKRYQETDGGVLNISWLLRNVLVQRHAPSLVSFESQHSLILSPKSPKKQENMAPFMRHFETYTIYLLYFVLCFTHHWHFSIFSAIFHCDFSRFNGRAKYEAP